MGIHRCRQSDGQMEINRFKNICPGSKFTIQMLEKLSVHFYKNGTMDSNA